MSISPLRRAKVLYAFILRRTELSRKNGWADEYGRIYLYYPICEVVDLLHCGRQKAVNTLRELQYAGLVEIQMSSAYGFRMDEWWGSPYKGCPTKSNVNLARPD